MQRAFGPLHAPCCGSLAREGTVLAAQIVLSLFLWKQWRECRLSTGLGVNPLQSPSHGGLRRKRGFSGTPRTPAAFRCIMFCQSCPRWTGH